MLSIAQLTCEYKVNPIGIDMENTPRISWKLHSDTRACLQSAYRIQISSSDNFDQLLWDSGQLNSTQSLHVELNGLRLSSRTRYYYRVKAWDNTGMESYWSEPAFFQTGLQNPGEWEAEWIAAPANTLRDGVCPQLRTFFNVQGEIENATIYVTALGLYELQLNKERVSHHYFTPGWTSYNNRLQYQTYDVTNDLHRGKNTLGALLGDGWYKGYLGWRNDREMYGSRRALLLELHIRYADGSQQHVYSDSSWQAAESPVLMSDIYMGEHYDAQLAYDLNDESAERWHSVEQIQHSKTILVPQENEPVTKIEYIKPIKLWHTPDGELVLDMGQNMVGWLRFEVKGKAGQTVELIHAEVLDSKGNFYRENIRAAQQRIQYTLKGDAKETFEPHFTFQGFRYVQLKGFGAEAALEDFNGVVLHSKLERTGEFECSDPLVNRLHHNILWGQKGNFLDVPTDCPQRDERMGWTGDAQAFVRTASYLMNTAPFFTKWLRDLQADQMPEGGVPFYIPNLKESYSIESNWGETHHSSAAWGDAATICPWTIYEMYGDNRLLAQQYQSMKKWVAYIYAQGDNPYLWNTGFHYGDWLALDSDKGGWEANFGATDRHYVATAFYAYSTSLVQKAAAALGYNEDAEYYQTLHGHIVQAFRNEYVASDGSLTVLTQTAHILALHFELVDGPVKERTVQKLKELLADAGDHLKTGFVGTPYLNPVLSSTGNNELAYRLLFHTDYPSWLYQVTKGATTVWEHWDGIKEDGSFKDGGMVSFNHYAYGSIGEWLYRFVAGIGPDESQPGFRRVHIKPMPGPGLRYVKASLETMYGTVACNWNLAENGTMELQITIPANATGEAILPGAKLEGLLENGGPVVKADGISGIEVCDGGVKVELGSGSYVFSYAV
ncbi:family 78 glycoside hydrolase catalytic domain [Paenibacillus sp. CAU 1782]